MEKLVAGNSYPNIDFSYGNGFDFVMAADCGTRWTCGWTPTGSGPATAALHRARRRGQPASNLRGVLPVCCTYEPSARCRNGLPVAPSTFSAAMIQPGGQILEPFGLRRPRRTRAGRCLERVLAISASACGLCPLFDYATTRQRIPSTQAFGACSVPAVPYTGTAMKYRLAHHGSRHHDIDGLTARCLRGSGLRSGTRRKSTLRR